MRRAVKTLSVLLVLVAGAWAAAAQTGPDLAKLRDDLRARFNIVGIQDGVALVPLDRAGDVRLIEVRDGAIAINGEAMSAKEVRTRLGRDADLVMRVTYLDRTSVQELAATGAAPPAPPTTPEVPEPPPSERTDSVNRQGDIVRIGDSVTVAENEQVDGDVVAIGGSAEILGAVEGDVVVVGGSLDLGPKSRVKGDVNVVGGSVDRAPGAFIGGKINDVRIGNIGPWRRGGDRDGDGASSKPSRTMSARWGVGGLVGTLVRGSLLLLGALLVMALGGRFVSTVAERTGSDPLRSGLIGLLAEVLFVPLLVITVVVLAISIIGIPLLLLVPFAIVLALVLMLIGFTGVAYQVGRWVAPRVGVSSDSQYMAVAVGVTAVLALTVVARLAGLAGGFVFGGFVSGLLTAVGYLLEYLAWTVGLGAVLLAWRRGRHQWSQWGGTPQVTVPEPGRAE